MEAELLLEGSSVLAVPLESNKLYCWSSSSDFFGTEEELMMMSHDGEVAASSSSSSSSSSSVQQQQQHGEEEGPLRRRESMLNKLISTVYSGPTISDIENALSFTGGDHQQQLAAMDARNFNSAGPVVFSPEKVLSKMENKYTLKIKTCGNGLAEDGYKWRKYGQKSIKNSPNPRSYYRCTNPRCNAKKQVERSTEEADTLLVTYEGLHLHYTYSHFLHQHHQPKKPKLHQPTSGGGSPPPQPQDLDGPAQQDTTASPQLDAEAATMAMAMVAPPPPTFCYLGDGTAGGGGLFQQQPAFFFEEPELEPEPEQQQQQQQLITTNNSNNNGLLEDMVPLLVRRPCSRRSMSTTGSSSTSSPTLAVPSPDLSATSSSVSWNPNSPYIDMTILSNIF